MMLGETWPGGLLRKGWTYLLKAHAHDSINGVTQDKIVDDNLYRLNQALEIAEAVYDDSIARLLQRLDLSKFEPEAQLLLIHNPQPRPVREMLRVSVDTPQEANVWQIGAVDADGAALTVQPISRDEHKQPVHDIEARPWPFNVDRHDVFLDSGEIPAGGYKVIQVTHDKTFWREEEWWPAMRKLTGEAIASSTHCLENDYLRIDVQADGTFDMLVKQENRLIKGMHFFEDEGDAGDYWAYYPPYENQIISSRGFPSSISLRENGPLAATICIEKTMRVPSRAEFGNVKHQGYGKRSDTLSDMKITTTLTLKKGSRQLDIKTRIENAAKDHRVRVIIPSDVQSDYSDAAGHFTVDRRHMVHEVDGEGRHYPEMALRPQSVFCSVSDGKQGLTVLNNCLTEFQLLADPRRSLALTLFRSVRNRICTESRVSAEFPEQLGSQMLQTLEFDYALYPHAGNWADAQAFAAADRLNASPKVFQVSRNASGDLPVYASFYAIDNEAVVLSTIKKAEDKEKGLILRLFNPTNTEQAVSIKVGFPLHRAALTDINETELQEIRVEDNQVALTLRKGQISTVLMQ
jgi:mannosylglycerate hydrolase